ncbi:hypothetical protein [Ornithinimicrobium kibberense]|uniref:hypothetical protein n=1 Tax=Ornithinimicrobium kibberense TaxID=282060 RepID=UPI00361B8FD2
MPGPSTGTSLVPSTRRGGTCVTRRVWTLTRRSSSDGRNDTADATAPGHRFRRRRGLC